MKIKYFTYKKNRNMNDKNPKRIAECVNACRGISHPSSIPAALIVLKKIAQGKVDDKEKETAIKALKCLGIIKPKRKSET